MAIIAKSSLHTQNISNAPRRSKKLRSIFGIIFSFIFIINTIPVFGKSESQDQNAVWKNESPTAQPSENAQQGLSNGTTIFLPFIHRPDKSHPRINVPYFDGDVIYPETAIFWLGEVTPTDNYADVRIGYNTAELYVNISIFDRRLWYAKNPNPGSLTEWDAVTLNINLNGDSGITPGTNAYKFISQLNWWEARDRWQASYRGNGSGWSAASVPFNASTIWRGNAPNDNTDDRGWTTTYHIPFTSLGLSGPPDAGTIWGLAVTVHDRDDSGGTPISDKVWPLTRLDKQPETWGQLHFGLPLYTGPQLAPGNAVTIRHKLSGAVVTDAEVGGHTVCGDPYSPKFFDGWGVANYSGYDQINIQNQSDVADWPCFSKFYINFPLPVTLLNKPIISANLRMYQFGGSNPPNAKPSLIQVMTVRGDWQEGTITWNNAPLAQENVSQTWVNPILQFPGWPGVPNNWDVSRAVSEVIQNGETNLRLVLYEADEAQHSGKYFITSDSGDWNALGRPTLTITAGQQ